MANLVVFTLLLTLAAATSATKQCGVTITNLVGNDAKTKYFTQNDLMGPPGPPGSPGAPGPSGPIGAQGTMPAECSLKLSTLEKRIEKLEESNMAYSEKLVARSCEDYLKADSAMKSGVYFISPNPKFEAPYQVHCKVDSGHAWTTFGHDSEAEIRAKDCEAVSCAKRNVKYNLSLKTIRAFVEKATSCRQYIKFRCIGVLNNWKANPYWSWMSYDKKRHLNWAEGVGDGMCKCGMTKTCYKKNDKCNCDNNSRSVTTFDDGYFTNKAQLPVIQMAFGDMGRASEKGWHTLGKLECY